MDYYPERIKQLRLDSNYTRKQMTILLNCSTSCYASYENGTRRLPLDVLIFLAKFYNVSSDYILGLSNYRGRITDSSELTPWHHE